jgi:hypothetical protein
MTEYVWDKFLTERDKAVFAAGGFGATADLGKRPALLVIDVSWAFCGDKPEPILDSIKLAQFMRGRKLGRGRSHQIADRQGACPRPAGDLHHCGIPGRQLGRRKLALEEPPPG